VLFVCIAILVAMHFSFCYEILQSFRNFFTSSIVFVNKITSKIDHAISDAKYIIFQNASDIVFDLKKENLRLVNELEQLQRLKIENNELRKLLFLKEKNDGRLVVARVISFLSNDYVCSFILDVGLRDKVSVDDVVLNADGLVGRVVEVHDDWSKIMLITDINSNVPVKIGERRINAIVSGDNTKTLKLSMIHEDDLPENGDIVETSKYGNIFLDKIRVGKIETHGETLRIVPDVNFNFIEYVGVLMAK
jgi:rod shape-determining protein MreC